MRPPLALLLLLLLAGCSAEGARPAATGLALALAATATPATVPAAPSTVAAVAVAPPVAEADVRTVLVALAQLRGSTQVLAAIADDYATGTSGNPEAAQELVNRILPTLQAALSSLSPFAAGATPIPYPPALGCAALAGVVEDQAAQSLLADLSDLIGRGADASNPSLPSLRDRLALDRQAVGRIDQALAPATQAEVTGTLPAVHLTPELLAGSEPELFSPPPPCR